MFVLQDERPSLRFIQNERYRYTVLWTFQSADYQKGVQKVATGRRIKALQFKRHLGLKQFVRYNC
jgi:hypothetical protein